MLFLNITNENRHPGTILRDRAPVLFPSALFTPHLYIETEFARITQIFEKIEHFSNDHVLGRMDITRIQTVICGDFLIGLYPRYFLRTCSYRSLAKDTIPEKP